MIKEVKLLKKQNNTKNKNIFPISQQKCLEFETKLLNIEATNNIFKVNCMKELRAI